MMSTTNNDAMSERRKRCEEWLLTEGLITGSADLTELSRSLEAFAKEQQIKGMETVKNEMRRSGNERLHGWIRWIEDEIYKLKEGG